MSILEVWHYLVELIGIHLILDCVDSTSFWSLLGKHRILGLSLGSCWFWTDSEQLYFTNRVLLEFSWLRAKNKQTKKHGWWACDVCSVHICPCLWGGHRRWKKRWKWLTNLLRGKSVHTCKVFSEDCMINWIQEILMFGWTIEKREKR